MLTNEVYQRWEHNSLTIHIVRMTTRYHDIIVMKNAGVSKLYYLVSSVDTCTSMHKHLTHVCMAHVCGNTKWSVAMLQYSKAKKSKVE